MAMIDAINLPDDVAVLKAMVVASEGRNLRKQDRINHLESLVAAFKQALFGAKSPIQKPLHAFKVLQSCG